METAAETVGAEASSILLYDDEGKLRFHSASGRAAQAVKPMSVEPGQGIAGWTAVNGEPAIVNDVAADPRFEAGFDRESGFVTRSILVGTGSRRRRERASFSRCDRTNTGIRISRT